MDSKQQGNITFLKAGLLGAAIPLSDGQSGNLGKLLDAARLEEIERRILAIEAMIWPLGR